MEIGWRASGLIVKHEPFQVALFRRVLLLVEFSLCRNLPFRSRWDYYSNITLQGIATQPKNNIET